MWLGAPDKPSTGARLVLQRGLRRFPLFEEGKSVALDVQTRATLESFYLPKIIETRE